MADVKEQLISLLRRSLCGTALTDAEKEGLNTQSLGTIYALAKSHDLAHMVADALYAEGIEAESLVAEKLQKAQMLAMFRYTKTQYDFEMLCEALETAQIPHLPLKGSVLRDYYPSPELRTSCDIDVLVSPDDLERAIAVLTEELGYRMERRYSHDVSLFSPSEIHVELHFDLLEKDEKVGEVLSSVWETGKVAEGKSYQYQMSHEMFAVYHIAHMAEHFMSGGCGVRPFLDLWVMKHKMGYDANKTFELLRACGLQDFAKGAMALSDVWLAGDAHTALTREIEDYVMGAGVYGTVENKIAMTQSTKKEGKLRYLWKRIFLPYGRLKQFYPKLENHPVLYPYYTVKRWIWFLGRKDKKRAWHELQASGKLSQDKKERISALCDALDLK